MADPPAPPARRETPSGQVPAGPSAELQQPGAQSTANGQWVEERPPPGLAQGSVAWPTWAIVLVTVAALTAALVLLAWLTRRRARLAPHGSTR